MNTDPDLLLRASACPGLLDGWCGPVAVDERALSIGHRSGYVPCVLVGSLPTGDCLVWSEAAGAGFAVDESVVYFDPARPEAADRAARWLAGWVGLAVGATAPRWEHDATARPTERGWLLCTTSEAVGFGPEAAPAWGDAHRHVPALASLDPADPRTAATGARWVDLRALVLCCEHVGASR